MPGSLGVLKRFDQSVEITSYGHANAARKMKLSPESDPVRATSGGPVNKLTSRLAIVNATLVLALCTPACGVVKGIFKAGVWAGILGVVMFFGLLVALLSSLRHR